VADLEAAEGHGDIGADTRAPPPHPVGRQPRRHIDGDNDGAATADGLDGDDGGDAVLVEGARQAGAKEGVDDHDRGRGGDPRRQLTDDDAGVTEVPGRPLEEVGGGGGVTLEGAEGTLLSTTTSTPRASRCRAQTWPSPPLLPAPQTTRTAAGALRALRCSSCSTTTSATARPACSMSTRPGTAITSMV
jgi:hypothetical protein